MTLPDLRLLCLADALSLVPEGARVWDPEDPKGYGTYLPKRLAYPPLPARVVWNTGFITLAPKTLVIDFSAPILSDGLPDRLDAFREFGLKVLSREAVGVRSIGPRAFALVDARDVMVASIASYNPHLAGFNAIVLDPWPNLADLTLDDAARAVVVEALIRGVKA